MLQKLAQFPSFQMSSASKDLSESGGADAWGAPTGLGQHFAVQMSCAADNLADRCRLRKQTSETARWHERWCRKAPKAPKAPTAPKPPKARIGSYADILVDVDVDVDVLEWPPDLVNVYQNAYNMLVSSLSKS